PVHAAAGQVLAEPVDARWALPLAAVSIMDGYAAKTDDLAGKSGEVELRRAGESAAGHPSAQTLASGEAARISTGAVLPDGSDIVVHDTDLGRIGALSCWEHLQPLTKYALFAQHEEIHVAAWPSFSCYPDAVALGPEVNTGVSRQYAVEGQCFVLAPCGVVSAAMIETLVESDVHAGLLLEGGGYARIYAPDGRELGEALGTSDEGLVIADLDFAAITVSKCFADPVGHYSRPDVTALLFNPEAQPPLVERRLPHRRGGAPDDENAFAATAAETPDAGAERG
ncbi:MAG: nitrilase-related carbon-nitrogen hydrolase, partial [Pseudomonadota bacterium]